MKKNAIAFLLSIVLAAGSIGTVPALASETAVQEDTSTERTEVAVKEAVLTSEEDEEAEDDQLTEEASESETEQTAEEEKETDSDEPVEEASEAETEQAAEEEGEEEIPEETEEADAGLTDEESSEGESAQETESEPEQESEESLDEDEDAVEQDEAMAADDETDETAALADTEETAITEEELLIEEGKEAKLAGDVVASGTCGGDAIWTLAGEGSNLTLTISGRGKMSSFTNNNLPWESEKTNIKTVVVENGITSIGYAAFYNCSNITSINLPDSVNYIASNAFSGCSSLTSINLPDGLASIFEAVFYNCSSLTSINIPDSIKRIEREAFSGCSSLTSITIPDSVTSIGYSVFKDCSSLKSITIPDGVTSIGSSAFYGCRNLTSIDLPDSVTGIDSFTFYGCSGLTSIDLSDRVTSIGRHAFEYCSGLTNIDLPDRVTSIGDHAFQYCSGLTSITIPDSMTSIASGTFDRCSSLTSITIPDSVTSIGDYAFNECSSLASITIPERVTSIENGTFFGCRSLTSITIPDSVTSIGSSAFSVCSGLTSITIPDSVTNIGDYAFYLCSGLTSITIPDSVTSIGNIAFYGCKSLILSIANNSYAVQYAKDNYLNYVLVANHVYGDWTVIKEATCTEKGIREKTCVDCGEKVTETIPMKSHSWNKSYTVDKEPTCTEEGSESIHCSMCNVVDETTIRAVPKADHAYGDWTVTKEATCTEDGNREKTCADCGDKATETIPANGHSWNEEYTVDKEATCTEEGTESIHCSDCGTIDKSTVRTIPKKDHTYGDWIVTREAICTEDGSKEKTCADCGDKATETIPANGHSWNEEYTVDKEATCTEEGSESIHCSDCDTIDETTVRAIPAKGHTWNEEYTVDKEATRTEEGSESIHCSVCDTSDESTVRAIPKISGYQIEYVLGGGENSTENPNLYYSGDEYELKDPVRVGYTFEGWYSDESLTDNITGITQTQTGKLVFYAKWMPNTYNVTFNGNTDSNGIMPQISYTVGSTVLPANAYTKKGHVFAGWNTKEDGTGTDIKNQGSLDALDAENGSSVTLYAQWKIKEYKIVYTLNGGTNNKSNPATYNYYKAVTSLANPTRKGYVFKGWFTDAEYKTAFAGIKKGSTGDKKVYAKWSAVKYSIQYVLNGGKAPTGNPASYYVTTATTKLKNPTRTGYTFAGWFKESTFKTKVTSVTKGSAGNLKLYAKWVPTKYTITYKLNGGTNNKSNPANYTITTAKMTLQKPTRKGYTFDGWYSDSSYKNKSAVVNKGSTGNKTFYAKWKINKYTISYVLNGGKAPSGNPAAYYVATADIKLKNPTRTNYTFAGWFKESTFKTKVTSIPKGSAGNLKLYAKWTATKYKITYNLNGGTNNKSNPATYTIATASITLQKPTRKGCVFEGWYSDSKFKNKVTAIPKGSTGNKTLYARWKIYEYIITYELNGGRFAVGNPASYNVKTPTITLLNAKKTGYVFAGWYKEASFKTRVTKIPKGSYGNLKLYAKWETPEENKIRRVYESILKDGEKAGNGKCISEYDEYSNGFAFFQTSIIANGDLIFTYYNENNMGWTTTGMISYSFKDRKWSPFIIENNDNYADFTAYAVIDPKTYCINDNKGIKGYTLKNVDYKTSNMSVANSSIELDVGEGIRSSFIYWDFLLKEELGISFADLGYSRFYASKYD